ncbi:MAG: hypothetical protein ACFCUR_08580 [Rhodomicrobiaceae bacterium]
MLITFAILVVIFVGGGFLLPDKVHVQRSTVINAEAGRVFPI